MSTLHSTLDLTIVHNASVRQRWTNLWWPASFAHGFAEECSAGDAFGEVDILVWVGNIVLVGGILLFLFIVHVAVISGLEAVWLSTVRKRSAGCLFSYRQVVMVQNFCGASHTVQDVMGGFQDPC